MSKQAVTVEEALSMSISDVESRNPTQKIERELLKEESFEIGSFGDRKSCPIGDTVKDDDYGICTVLKAWQLKSLSWTSMTGYIVLVQFTDGSVDFVASSVLEPCE